MFPYHRGGPPEIWQHKKYLEKKVLKSQNSEDEEDADEVVGCSSGIFVDHLYISQPRGQRNIVVLLVPQCVTQDVNRDKN